MTAYALLFTLSAIGISETVYLIRKRRAGQRPVCVIGEQCHEVLESKYNKILGVVHNDILGLLLYFFISFITSFFVIGIEPLELWKRIAEISILLATLTSLFLIYIQWRVIKAWCFWCLMSAFTVFLMAGIILTTL